MLALFFLVASNPFFWRPQTEVRVYFMPGFNESQKFAAMRGMESWRETGGIRFTMSSDVATIQTCDDCLTLRRAKPYNKKLAALGAVYFTGSGFIKYAWIDTQVGDAKALQSLVAHETGHALGLLDCDCDSVMGKLGGFAGWPLPNQRDLMQAQSYYAGLK